MTVVACVPSRRIEHPLPLAAVVVLVLNDHVLKGAGILPSWLTGKLSDVAGLFFFPVLLVSLARALRLRLEPWLAALVTALAFSAVKLVPVINALVAGVWGPMVMDATDLFTLPMCAMAAIWMTSVASKSEAPPDRRPWARFFAMVGASLASLATPAMHYPPCRELPPEAVHVGWETTCIEPPKLSVQLSPGSARITLPLRPKEKGCASPLRAFALEWQATPDVHVVATMHPRFLPKSALIEQESVIEAVIDLPYPAQCATLGTRVVGQPQIDESGAHETVIDTPIASCSEGQP